MGCGHIWRPFSEALDPPLGYKAASAIKKYASLEVMWKQTRALETIVEDGCDVVVLQEDIPETTVDSFQEYSRRFVKAIRDVGGTAHPVHGVGI